MNTLEITNLNEVYVHVKCEPGIALELRDHFTFEVPGFQFSPLYKARIWDGKIRLWDNRHHTIYRGLVPKIAEFAESRNYTWSYDNEVYDEEFSLVEAQAFIDNLNPSLNPHDHQMDAFVHAIRTRRVLLRSPTSSGKSLIAYLIFNKLLAEGFTKGLIIVPTIQLVEQLYKDFQDYSRNNGLDVDKMVHRIYQGKEKNTKKPITISTWQSIYKQEPEWFEGFDFVIGDECHLFKAKSLTTIMTSLVNTQYRIGMTGTLDGSKTHKLVLEGLFGSVRDVISTAELIEKKIVADFSIKAILLKHPPKVLKGDATYQDEIKYIVTSPARNRFIANLALSLKGNTIIFFQFVEHHGIPLHDMIKKKLGDSPRKVFLIHGDVDADIREQIRAIVETESDAIIVASSGTTSTGVSIRNVHNLIFSSPSKGRIRNLQSIGRGLRISDTKSAAILYDIADDLARSKELLNFTLKHFVERLRIYNEEKFPYKIYKVSLKT